MKLLNTNAGIQKAKFANKVDHIEDIQEDIEYMEKISERYKIVEVAVMTEEEYNEFSTSMMADWDFLDGKGGTDSTTATEAHESKRMFEWTKEEMDEFRKGAYRECIGITTPQANEMIVVDPQGHNYARYSALVKG
ncbi:hypothetical protein CHL76_02150 [Marinococcus halophilus]|uniref:Uncharacterized protein n=1 Tax=Marinococcus halophilus TaxID=1371 RepID=A0A510Y1F0_MARHA|nr:hypothetical protein [Marinococcus halophilus]OZT81179.1 hypothetical protein CHL76_02150 [Marinococcus halophilus]GEK57109.1 hypothetical protein MHA01_00140 [Marinococcus halophilus]